MRARTASPRPISRAPRWLAAGMVVCATLSALAVQAAAGNSAAAVRSAKSIDFSRLPDAAGKRRSLSDFKASKVVVLLFLGTKCPISNSYAESVSKLADSYSGRGVQFIGVNSILEDSAADVAAHAREFKYAFPVLKDSDQKLADLVGARVTPEAFVLDANRRVRYQGRLNDQFASRVQRRTRVTHTELTDAVEALLAGKPVLVAQSQAVGCPIARPEKGTSASLAVSYHKDVAPILQERCQSCHRPGQIAPFSLTSFADAKSWASEIKLFTANRQMPPWKAEPGHGDFHGVRRMPDAEIATLARWADAGAPEGDVRQAPPQKQWSDSWSLGTPDLVLTMPDTYTVAASGEDDFRCFVLPTGLMDDKEVVGVEIRPGNPKVVHHVLNFIDTSGRGRQLDEKDSGPGYASGLGGVGFFPSGSMGGWAPGNFPRYLPQGVGMPLPKGSDIVMQVHYHKTGKVEQDKTAIGLYFAKKPIEKRYRVWPLTSLGIDIPPGVERHEVKASMVIPWDTHALSVTPHMHLLGREIKVTATLPDKSVRNMIWIKDWDYRWQDTYVYQDPLPLPKGTRLDLVAYFDNSTRNPLNPSTPPRRVTFGEQTTDEMCFAFVGFTMDQELPGQQPRLLRGLFGE